MNPSPQQPEGAEQIPPSNEGGSPAGQEKKSVRGVPNSVVIACLSVLVIALSIAVVILLLPFLRHPPPEGPSTTLEPALPPSNPVTKPGWAGPTAAFGDLSGLPDGWADRDIGGPGLKGSVLYETNPPTFTVKGSGADLWFKRDQIHLVYQMATGDCQITARVADVGNTHAYAKAGVMMRESLSSGSTHATVDLTPTSGAEYVWRRRPNDWTGSASHSGVSAPWWVRLVRSGDTFTGFTSSNGVDWLQLSATNIPMSNTICVGLVVCAHANTKLMTATFDHVMLNLPRLK